MSGIIHALVLGLGTGLALIVAIGAQNAFVLRQGLLGRHVAAVVLVCAASDAVLIAAGVAGMGSLVSSAPGVVVVVRYLGAAFLFCYGVMAARRALRPHAALLPTPAGGEGSSAGLPGAGSSGTRAGAASSGTAMEESAAPSALATRPKTAPRPASGSRPAGLAATVATILALTWLNPHVYLDTVVLLGSVANSQGSGLQWWFGAGAVLGSVLWFSALGFGARLLRGFFARPASWRVLDGIIAATMVALAVTLALGA
ncbi:amino acid transporter [Arthrobacter sp. SW1]|nr:amino acid transporter [Arthrobacter sp. SW1]